MQGWRWIAALRALPSDRREHKNSQLPTPNHTAGNAVLIPDNLVAHCPVHDTRAKFREDIWFTRIRVFCDAGRQLEAEFEAYFCY
jgi:hypothetical protein